MEKKTVEVKDVLREKEQGELRAGVRVRQRKDEQTHEKKQKKERGFLKKRQEKKRRR